MDAKLFIAKAGVVLKQAAPEILTGGGIVLGIAALIVACSKMKKFEAETEKTQEELEEVQNGREECTKMEYAKACFKVGTKAVWRFLKVFWIPILLEILSIIAIWYSHGIMVKRNAMLASTAFALTQQLESYRARVRNKVGEEVENDLFYDLTNNKIGTQIEMLEDGKTKKTPIYEKVIGDGCNGPFTYIFDKRNDNYQSMPGANIENLNMIVRAQQNILESRATKHTDGWMFSWEMEEALGFDPHPEINNWGWTFSRDNPLKCDTIDIGITDKSNQIVHDFLNKRESAIPLHFNCHPLNLAAA